MRSKLAEIDVSLLLPAVGPIKDFDWLIDWYNRVQSSVLFESVCIILFLYGVQ